MDFTVDMLEISQMIENGKKQQKEIEQRKKEKQQEKRQQKKETIILLLIIISLSFIFAKACNWLQQEQAKAINNCVSKGHSQTYCERLAQ